MKLLLDENLSCKLAARLAGLFPNTSHVRDFSLLASPDSAIWEFARQNEFTIVTTDTDFFEMVTNFGPPPKVIWLKNWTKPTAAAEALLRREAIRINAFLEDPELGLLVLHSSK